MERWILAAVWATLPLTAGGALGDAVAHWPNAPAVVAAVVVWTVWAIGLLAIAVPRPVGLTVLRVVAPDLVVAAVVVLVASDAPLGGAVVALVATLVAAVLVARPALARTCLGAVAYGDEERFPLRVPTLLYLGPLPAVRLLVGAAVVAGPLLLADGRWVLGAACVVVGGVVVWLGGRALHGLSGRFVVLVPAGFVIVDPLTLADPVLFLRERIVGLRAVSGAPPPGALDLRLGATAGTVELALTGEAEVFRATRGRRGASTVRAATLLVAVPDRALVLRRAGERRIPVTETSVTATQTATPPPSSTSPS